MLTLSKEHVYSYDGKVVPGVTNILQCVGVRKDVDSPWISMAGGDFMMDEVASAFGTEFHNIAAYILEDTPIDYDPAFEPWVKGLKKFLDKYELIPQLIEEGLYSNKYGYAGTLDVYAEIYLPKANHPHPIIIDWKTSTTLPKHARKQTAAYSQLVKENLGISRRPYRWTVQILPDDYKIDKRQNQPQDWNRFLSNLNTYKEAA